MSPDLVEAVVEHLDWLRRTGMPTGPDDYLVPNLPVSASGRIQASMPELRGAPGGGIL
jgi:hypothetical protein